MEGKLWSKIYCVREESMYNKKEKEEKKEQNLKASFFPQISPVLLLQHFKNFIISNADRFQGVVLGFNTLPIK